MDTKSFSEVRRRVIAALKASQISALQSEVSRRISKDPLHFLDGSQVSEPAKFKIFKHSLISIFSKRTEDEEYSLSQHLVRILFDCLAEPEMKEVKIEPDQHTGDTLPLVKPVTEITQTAPKPKGKSKRAKKALAVEPPLQVEEVIEESVPKVVEPKQSEMDTLENEANLSSQAPSLPTTHHGREIHENSVESQDNSTNSSRQSKKRTSSVTRSATPGTPGNVEFAKKRIYLDPRSDATDISVEDSWKAVYRVCANNIRAQDMERIMGWSPRSVGLICRAKTIGQCYYCIKAYLTYPVTSCESVKCNDKQHHEVFVHSIAEYDINDFHDDGHDIKLLYQLMVQKTIMPAIHYIMTHDADFTRARKNSSDTLSKTVQYYFDMRKQSRR